MKSYAKYPTERQHSLWAESAYPVITSSRSSRKAGSGLFNRLTNDKVTFKARHCSKPTRPSDTRVLAQLSNLWWMRKLSWELDCHGDPLNLYVSFKSTSLALGLARFILILSWGKLTWSWNTNKVYVWEQNHEVQKNTIKTNDWGTWVCPHDDK